MNRIDIILEKEQTNTSKIFIYMLNGRFIAFGYSAYYTALLCPKVIASWSHTDASSLHMHPRRVSTPTLPKVSYTCRRRMHPDNSAFEHLPATRLFQGMAGTAIAFNPKDRH